MNLAIWDIESSSASTDFGSIIEIGGILVDENFKERDRFNFRCRLPEGEIPQAMALIVNKTSVKQLTQGNLSHYQMLNEVEKTFKKWSPAIFLGWSNIGFDDEMIRKEFFKGIRYPYITNASPNKRHDGINIARAAYAIDPNVLETEINKKGNEDKLEFGIQNTKLNFIPISPLRCCKNPKKRDIQHPYPCR